MVAVWKSIESHGLATRHVTGYIEHIAIYFARTRFPREIGRHVEGCIGWNLRNNYRELNIFYTADNHVGTMKDRLGKTITITSDQPIAGLDPELDI